MGYNVGYIWALKNVLPDNFPVDKPNFITFKICKLGVA